MNWTGSATFVNRINSSIFCVIFFIWAFSVSLHLFQTGKIGKLSRSFDFRSHNRPLDCCSLFDVFVVIVGWTHPLRIYWHNALKLISKRSTTTSAHLSTGTKHTCTHTCTHIQRRDIHRRARAPTKWQWCSIFWMFTSHSSSSSSRIAACTNMQTHPCIELVCESRERAWCGGVRVNVTVCMFDMSEYIHIFLSLKVFTTFHFCRVFFSSVFFFS